QPSPGASLPWEPAPVAADPRGVLMLVLVTPCSFIILRGWGCLEIVADDFQQLFELPDLRRRQPLGGPRPHPAFGRGDLVRHRFGALGRMHELAAAVFGAALPPDPPIPLHAV